jgi:hypothetical protein
MMRRWSRRRRHRLACGVGFGLRVGGRLLMFRLCIGGMIIMMMMMMMMMKRRKAVRAIKMGYQLCHRVRLIEPNGSAGRRCCAMKDRYSSVDNGKELQARRVLQVKRECLLREVIPPRIQIELLDCAGGLIDA